MKTIDEIIAYLKHEIAVRKKQSPKYDDDIECLTFMVEELYALKQNKGRPPEKYGES